MSREPIIRDGEQEAYDAEDAMVRIKRLSDALIREEAARERVKACESALVQARREAKEAHYQLLLIAWSERRRADATKGGA